VSNLSKNHIKSAGQILEALGLPKAQQKERSALCLLALLNVTPDKEWTNAGDPLIGITPIMKWVAEHYSVEYAPNTREAFRRHTIHQFAQAGLILENPDEPGRPVNSPHFVYQIEPQALKLLRKFDSRDWDQALKKYLKNRPTLIKKFAKERKQRRIAVKISSGEQITLSPGKHNELIKKIVESFAPRFAPDSTVVYIGDTGKKWAHFDHDLLSSLGVEVDAHGKMPDVVLHYTKKNWLLLVESVTSHGPVDGKRHQELTRLFAGSTAGLVYVTAFPSRTIMSRYLAQISWETEVWVADAPSHLIHFNGERFLGPYTE